MVVVTLIEMMNMMFGVVIVVGVQEQQIVEVEKVVAVKIVGTVDIEEKLGVIFVDTLAVVFDAFVVNFEMDIVEAAVIAVVEFVAVEQMIVD
jgi:hypothetical protein